MARQRHSGFQGDVTHGGKRYRTSGWKTEAAATVWEHQALANLIMGKPVPPGPSLDEAPTMTLEELLGYTYREHWSTTNSAQTYKDRISSVTKLLGANYPAADLATPVGFAALRAACEAKGNGGNTINKKFSLISKAIKFCIQRGKLQGISPPVYESLPMLPGRKRVISREEEAAHLQWLTSVDQDIADWYLLCIDTGPRVYSEALHVYPHIDVRAAELHIRGRIITPSNAGPNVVEVASASRRTKTGTSRVVGLTSRVMVMIQRRLPKLGRSDRLFPDGLSDHRIQDRWTRMKLALGAEDATLVPYSLRHTFGTRMILAGAKIEELQVLMGHASIAQTMEYVHLAGLVQKGAVSKLEAYLEQRG